LIIDLPLLIEIRSLAILGALALGAIAITMTISQKSKSKIAIWLNYNLLFVFVTEVIGYGPVGFILLSLALFCYNITFSPVLSKILGAEVLEMRVICYN
jgi:integral membrane sensor domain MASE1